MELRLSKGLSHAASVISDLSKLIYYSRDLLVLQGHLGAHLLDLVFQACLHIFLIFQGHSGQVFMPLYVLLNDFILLVD
jgi:hypothetical protein